MSDSRWPVPQWSAMRLEHLRTLAASAERDPFNAMLAQIGLAAADGQRERAQKCLRRVAAEFPPATVHPGHFRGLFAAAVQAHEPGLAAAWLAERMKSARILP